MIASFCNHGSLRASSPIWASEASRERTWISSCVPLAQLLFKISPKWRAWSQATITAKKQKKKHTHTLTKKKTKKKNKRKTWKALHLLPLRSFGKWHCTFMDPTAQRNITFASLKKRLPFLSSLFSADRAKGDWGERKKERAMGADWEGKREEERPAFPFLHRSQRAYFLFLFLSNGAAETSAEEGPREAMHGYALNYRYCSVCQGKCSHVLDISICKGRPFMKISETKAKTMCSTLCWTKGLIMKTSEILKSKENALHSMFNKAMFT